MLKVEGEMVWCTQFPGFCKAAVLGFPDYVKALPDRFEEWLKKNAGRYTDYVYLFATTRGAAMDDAVAACDSMKVQEKEATLLFEAGVTPTIRRSGILVGAALCSVFSHGVFVMFVDEAGEDTNMGYIIALLGFYVGMIAVGNILSFFDCTSRALILLLAEDMKDAEDPAVAKLWKKTRADYTDNAKGWKKMLDKEVVVAEEEERARKKMAEETEKAAEKALTTIYEEADSRIDDKGALELV
jgi:hypothetical protein